MSRNRALLTSALVLAAAPAMYFFVLAPWRAAALARAAELQLKAGLHDDALKSCERALEIRSTVAEAYAVRGWIRSTIKKDYIAGRGDCHRAVALNPSCALAFTARSFANAEFQRYQESLADATRAVELDPSSAFAWAALAQAKSILHEEDAAAAATRAIELEPRSAFLHQIRSDALSRIGRIEEAMRDAEIAVILDPGRSQVYVTRAYRHMDRWQFRRAVAESTRAIEADGNPDGYICRADAYLGLGWSEPARKDCSDVLSEQPQFLGALISRAAAWSEEGEDDKAVADCTRVLDQLEMEGALIRRASALARMSPSSDAAAEDWKRALELNEWSIDALVARANSNLGTAAHDQTMQDFNQACRISPRSIHARIQRCAAMSNFGDIQGALWDAEYILQEIDPRSVGALLYRAYAHMHQGTPESLALGILECDQALARSPEHQLPYVFRSGCWDTLARLSVQSKPAEAERASLEGLQDAELATLENPKSAEAFAFLASVQLARGEFESAERSACQAQNLLKGYTSAACIRAKALFHLKGYEPEMPALAEAKEHRPNDYHLWQTMGDIELAQSNKVGDLEAASHLDRAKAYYKKAIELSHPSVHALIDESGKNVEISRTLRQSNLLYERAVGAGPSEESLRMLQEVLDQWRSIRREFPAGSKDSEKMQRRIDLAEHLKQAFELIVQINRDGKAMRDETSLVVALLTEWRHVRSLAEPGKVRDSIDKAIEDCEQLLRELQR